MLNLWGSISELWVLRALGDAQMCLSNLDSLSRKKAKHQWWMKNRSMTKVPFSLSSSSFVAAAWRLPSGVGALGDSHVCWGTAGFSVILLWSPQASLGLQATTPTLVPFPVCSGGTCHPAMTVCSAWLSSPVPLSLRSVVPELWFPTACQQHALCPCHLSPITPAAATCSGTLPTSLLLPSVLAMLLQRRKNIFFLISGCCWTVTQPSRDVWEIECRLSLRECTHSHCCQDIQPPSSEVCAAYCSRTLSTATIPPPPLPPLPAF